MNDTDKLLTTCKKYMQSLDDNIRNNAIPLNELGCYTSYDIVIDKNSSVARGFEIYVFTLNFWAYYSSRRFTPIYGIYEFERVSFEFEGFDIVQLGFFLGLIKQKYNIESDSNHLMLPPDVSKIGEYYQQCLATQLN